ncbi:putative helicase helY domain protein [Mycobacterium xenopi 3993]|nr:putative helicase helY domain protein [Mycobacterium xenopi 3993]
MAAATNSLARTFDRIVGLLTERGFIRMLNGDPQVTEDGRLLAESTARATFWSPNVCAPACGPVCGPRSWRRCCRRCSTSHEVARARARRSAPTRRPRRCGARWLAHVSCRRSCAPTSNGIASA